MKDEKLRHLIARICGNPEQKTWERRQAINCLLRELQYLPGLPKSSHQYYLEALNRTWEWVSERICDFEPRLHESVQRSLERWIKGYLSWRIRDLYRQNNPNQYSLHSLISNHDENSETWLDKLQNTTLNCPTLSGLEGYLEQLHTQEIREISFNLEIYIEQDPEGKLRKCHPRKHPDCNCQLLSQRLLLQSPPARLTDVSRELRVNYRTLKSHWENKCRPLLQEIAIALGYQRQ